MTTTHAGTGALQEPSPSPPPSPQALARAADWFALLLSGEASAEDSRDWQAWLAASDEHRRAWASVERLRTRLAPIHDASVPRLAASAWRQSRAKARRQVLLGLVGVATVGGMGVLGTLAWREPSVAASLEGWAQGWLADHHTGTGEVRDVLLADGSRLWLNAASALNQRYQSDARALQLLHGEVFIETAADPRPFSVQTPHGRLHALGTRFAVRLDENNQTLLAVYQGAVAIQTHGQTRASITVGAGEQRRFDANAIAPAESADPAREAWRRGLLIARHISLAEVVAQLRPYQRGHLSLTPELALLPVFGSYPLTDPEQALTMLAEVMPIRIRRPFPGWVRIVPAP